jgi:hypothetical protein
MKVSPYFLALSQTLRIALAIGIAALHMVHAEESILPCTG